VVSGFGQISRRDAVPREICTM